MAVPDVASLRAGYSGPHDLVPASDGKILFIRRWDGKADSPVSVLILHGITAYSQPYGPMVAEQLARAGFNVFGLDLRGHGLSDGQRGDYPSEDRLVKDLTETLSFVKSKSRKLVVLGHSLGVLSAIIAVNNRPEDIDGLVLLSAARKIRAGVYAKPKPGAVLRTLIGVAILRGSPVIEYRREGMVGVDDLLFNFKYSARFYSVLYGVGALSVTRMFRSGIIDSPNLKFNQKLRVPVLMGVGDQDELFTPETVREFCDETDCDDKGFFVAQGARHAVWPKDVWEPLTSWLGKKF